MELLQSFFLEGEIKSLFLAVLICIFTAIVKQPIKILASKMANGQAITKYITFLPIILSFGGTVALQGILCGEIIWDDELYSLWLQSAGFSLAIYAFLEKFVPSKKKILSEEELKQNLALLEELKQKMGTSSEESQQGAASADTALASETSISENTAVTGTATGNTGAAKLILRGRKRDENTAEQK